MEKKQSQRFVMTNTVCGSAFMRRMKYEICRKIRNKYGRCKESGK
jgi:hypothetical protein